MVIQLLQWKVPATSTGEIWARAKETVAGGTHVSKILGPKDGKEASGVCIFNHISLEGERPTSLHPPIQEGSHLSPWRERNKMIPAHGDHVGEPEESQINFVWVRHEPGQTSNSLNLI
jgi:hypothetical protein